ncbi:MAG: hypothetical protein ACOCRO_02975 [Halanaerobiales bacterium]
MPQLRNNEIEKAREYTWQIGLVYRIIKMKVEFAAAGFEVVHENDRVEKFYQNIYNDLDIDTFVRAAAFEHEVVGEWTPFYTWDNKGNPKTITILNPKFVKPHSILGEDVLLLRPTPSFRELSSHTNPRVRKKVKNTVPNYIYKQWDEGQEAILEEDNAQRYYNIKAYHNDEANSPLRPIFADIEILRMLQEADFATAKQLKQSILQIKIGDENYQNGGAIGENNFNQVIDQFNEAAEGYSTIEWFTQWFVNAEYITPDVEMFSSDKYEGVVRRILDWSGMNVMLEDKGSHGQSYVKLKGLRQEIQNTRNTIRKALNNFNKWIAEKNGKTYYNDLKIPKIRFDDDVLQDEEQVKNFIKFLYKHGLLSAEDTLDNMGYNFERQMRKKGEEEGYKNLITVHWEDNQGLVEKERYENND